MIDLPELTHLPLAPYLQKLRGEMPLEELERRTGIPATYLGLLERGWKNAPHPRILRKLAKYYNIPVVELYKQADYLPADEAEVVMEEGVKRAFLDIIRHPDFTYDTSFKVKYDKVKKQFIVERKKGLNGL